MNEDTNIQETPAEVIDDGWDDEGLDLSDVTDDEADEAGQEPETEEKPEGEADPAEAEADKQEAEKPKSEQEADQSFTLNYMGENRTVTREEAVALAQKGMDYDRVRQSRDEAVAEKDRLAKSVSYMEELAKTQGMTLDEMIDNAQAALRAQKENITPEAARERVRLERRERELTERENALKEQKTQDDTKQQETEKRNADIRNFVNTYPGVDPKGIPKEVWGEVAKGASLTEAYARHENQQLKLALEAEKKNRENEARAAGSRSTEGQKDKQDLIDKYWDEDD